MSEKDEFFRAKVTSQKRYKKGVHEGHRGRMRDKLFNSPETLTELDYMEMLLFHAIPRRDVRQLAFDLLEKFGRIRRVLSAGSDVLMREEEVGEGTAVFLSTVNSLVELSEKSFARNPGKQSNFLNIANSVEFLIKQFENAPNEELIILYLDGDGKLVGMLSYTDFLPNSTSVEHGDILKEAVARNAKNVIISHNHKNSAMPSAQDYLTTESIAQALFSLHVRLLDHIIICGDKFYSFEQTGELKEVYDAVLKRHNKPLF